MIEKRKKCAETQVAGLGNRLVRTNKAFAKERMKRKLARLLCVAAAFLPLAPVGAWAQVAAAFPYPAIPQELRTVDMRVDFLTEHYWDCYDFSDTALVHKPDITEQGFANFIDLLPRVDSATAVKGVAVFSGLAFRTSTPRRVRENFAELAEHYLSDPNSPMRSDALYMLFLDRLAASPAFSQAERERFVFKRTNIAKNSMGTTAADFAYVDRSGRKGTLHTTEGEYTLLYFYDPDCEHCHETTSLFSKNSLLTDNPRLTVLAVYPDADTDLWRKEPQPFPAKWIDAYSPNGEIAEKQLYYIRATPTILLLDRQKRVLLKDPTPALLLQYLSKVCSKD